MAVAAAFVIVALDRQVCICMEQYKCFRLYNLRIDEKICSLY